MCGCFNHCVVDLTKVSLFPYGDGAIHLRATWIRALDCRKIGFIVWLQSRLPFTLIYNGTSLFHSATYTYES